MSDDEDELIGFKDVCRICGISKAEVNRRIAAGKFAVPIKDGTFRNSRVLFSRREIHDLVKAKLASRTLRPSL